MSGLLGEAPEFFHAVRDALVTGPSAGEVGLFYGSIFGAVVLLLALIRVFGTSGKRETPAPDYLTLAVDALGLTEQDRRDLHTLARRSRVTPPGVMLVSPRNLALVLQECETVHVDPELRRRAGALCRRLFDCGLPDVRSIPSEDEGTAAGGPGPARKSPDLTSSRA